MKKCDYYADNNYCNLYNQYVASAYRGDICEHGKETSETEGCCYDDSDFSKKKDVFDINPYE